MLHTIICICVTNDLSPDHGNCTINLLKICQRIKFERECRNLILIALSPINKKLVVLPSEENESSNFMLVVNDGYQLNSERVGNFEWWYFDCIDIRKGCILKIVFHLGTDPMRKTFFPTMAISLKTPEVTRTIEIRYNLEDFQADRNNCDIQLKQDCHVCTEYDNPGNYHIDINISEFHASLTFKQTIPGWVPPAHKIKAVRNNRESVLYWNVPHPGSVVNGYFEYNNINYTLTEAAGYHDHNYWQLNSKKALFMDQVITKWFWGRCVADPYKVIFMETWMNDLKLSSVMISENDKIIFDSDKNFQITVNEETLYEPLKTKYPSQIDILINNEDLPLKIKINSAELIDSKDLLKEVNPLISRLIKCFVSRPSYYGLYSTVTVETKNQKVEGFGIYESVLLRTDRAGQ